MWQFQKTSKFWSTATPVPLPLCKTYSTPQLSEGGAQLLWRIYFNLIFHNMILPNLSQLRHLPTLYSNCAHIQNVFLLIIPSHSQVEYFLTLDFLIPFK